MKIPTHRLESLLDNILALILKAALLLTRAQLCFPTDAVSASAAGDDSVLLPLLGYTVSWTSDQSHPAAGVQEVQSPAELRHSQRRGG